jgi:hypothetical protein
LPDRHFVVCYNGSRCDLREISAEVAASVMSYGVVNMDYVCQAGECWHFAHRQEREAALAVLIPMVEASQRDSSLK